MNSLVLLAIGCSPLSAQNFPLLYLDQYGYAPLSAENGLKKRHRVVVDLVQSGKFRSARTEAKRLVNLNPRDTLSWVLWAKSVEGDYREILNAIVAMDPESKRLSPADAQRFAIIGMTVRDMASQTGKPLPLPTKVAIFTGSLQNVPPKLVASDDVAEVILIASFLTKDGTIGSHARYFQKRAVSLDNAALFTYVSYAFQQVYGAAINANGQEIEPISKSQFALAKLYAQKAIAKAPDVAVGYYMLGGACLQLGEKSNAKTAFLRYLNRTDTSPARRDRALQLLDQLK